MELNLQGKKILVAGGAGFIGSHTVDALVERGAEVAIVDNLLTGWEENLNPKAKFYKINIADEQIEQIMDSFKPEYVYIFSFFVKVPQSVENPLLDMDNIIGTLRILQKAKTGSVKRIVYSSSGFLYGNTPNLPATEKEPVIPISPYVVAKRAVENYLEFYRRAFGLDYVIFRYAAIYGPRQHTGAMADYIRKLAAGKQAEMWGDGTKTRDYVFIKDVVRANLMALTMPQGHPEPIFNIGTSKETTLNELYWKIAEILGKEPKPIYYPDRPGEQIRYCLDYSKIKNELGWQPQYSLEEGLKETIEFARSKNFQI